MCNCWSTKFLCPITFHVITRNRRYNLYFKCFSFILCNSFYISSYIVFVGTEWYTNALLVVYQLYNTIGGACVLSVWTGWIKTMVFSTKGKPRPHTVDGTILAYFFLLINIHGLHKRHLYSFLRHCFPGWVLSDAGVCSSKFRNIIISINKTRYHSLGPFV